MLHSSRSTTSSVIHTCYDAIQVPSKRHRNYKQTRLLVELGHKVVVMELQGELMFTSAEIIIHEVMKVVEKAEYLILDFTRTAAISEGADRIFAGLIQSLVKLGKTLLLTGTWDKYQTVKRIKKRIGYTHDMPLFSCLDIDHALEWCEDRLLAEEATHVTEVVPIAEQAYLVGFTAEEIAAFETLVEHKTYEKGIYLCRYGDASDSMYFILSGQVSVMLPLAHQRKERIATISAGSAFGEMAMLDYGTRSADVVTDEIVTCLILDYKRLEEDNSHLGMSIKLKLIKNIGLELNRRLRQHLLEIKLLRS